MTPFQWAPLILAVVTAVMECVEKNRTDDEIIGEFKQPRIFMGRFLEARMRRKNNIGRYEWNQKYRADWEKYQQLTDEQRVELANQFIAKAKNDLVAPSSASDDWFPTLGGTPEQEVVSTEE